MNRYEVLEEYCDAIQKEIAKKSKGVCRFNKTQITVSFNGFIFSGDVERSFSNRVQVPPSFVADSILGGAEVVLVNKYIRNVEVG